MKKQELHEKYLDLANHYHLQFLIEEKFLFLISMLRLIVFVGGIGLSSYGFTKNSFVGTSVLLIFISLFLVLVKLYSLHDRKKNLLENLVNINRNEVKALSYDLSPFQDGSQWIDSSHDFSNDLDLFGTGSVFQYLNRTVSGYGNKILAIWLSEPFSLATKIKERQEAVHELSSNLTWRQEFIAKGMGHSFEEKDLAGLLDWLNDKQKFFQSVFGKFIIFLLPSVASLSLVLLMAGMINYSFFTFFFLLNLSLVAWRLRSIGKLHMKLSKNYIFLSSLGTLLATFEKEPFKSPVLRKIQSDISGAQGTAVIQFKKLSRILQAFDNRINLLVGLFLNGLLLWDFHCVYKLEKWKEKSKDRLPQWLNHLGEIDAFISLANFAYNNPDFVYPVVTSDKSILKAKNLGHPLIHEENRVCNDFILPGSGHICIITGANMAGKSTFLRTVAVNYILGMTGAAVCATEMDFMPLRLFTSMRTSDSLDHNESYFYAELKRLRILKERLEEGVNILFILDEILKGTNSNDKSNGSKLFLKKLIGLGGTGLIATHDTSLGEMEEEFPELIANRCFEIEIEEERIIFDYKLQNGITQKMNASMLLRQMGLTE
ncbi:MAG: hypothetical protein M0R39_05820 [Prolixibacteraceae bacterium]|nr:hypothetical protein [Prolixibacteraceae bacterium]